MESYKLKVIITLTLLLCMSSCDQSTKNEQTTQVAKTFELTNYSEAATHTNKKSMSTDVRLVFIAQPKPLLTKQASMSVFAASDKKLSPKTYVKNLNLVASLVFANDDTLYYEDSYKNTDEVPKNSIELDTAIFVIKPNGENRLLAESGILRYATGDDGRQGPVYNGFGRLSTSSNGNLITTKNEAYPFEINVKTGVQSIISFKTTDGRLIQSEDDFGIPDAKNYPLSFSYAQSDTNGYFIVWNNMKKRWYRYHFGEEIQEMTDLNQLPSQAYLHMYFMKSIIKTEPINLEFQYYILGKDGYIYSVELGNPPFPVLLKRQSNIPDRVIRIGDAGLSSLRKEATRTVIAEFKHGTLTGALAFNAKGELAVGALNTIYLISPTNPSTNSH